MVGVGKQLRMIKELENKAKLLATTTSAQGGRQSLPVLYPSG
jgi:hypothetical protein